MARIFVRFFWMALLLPAVISGDSSAGNWPHWRGPEANGISTETSLPLKWSAEENVAWKVRVPGRGMSTPIIWQGKVFVTSQLGNGKVAARSARYEGPVPPDDQPVIFLVQCLRLADGRLLWEHRVPAETPLPPVHAFHNLASASPVTDGERLYALFGTGQLLALDFAGRVLWQRNLGKEISPFQLQWGHGSSPVVFQDTLILQCDHEPAAYLLALDRQTGKTLWRTGRGDGLRSYSTPLVVEAEGGQELIVNSNNRIDAYDPVTGRLLWHADGDCRVPVPMAVSAGGVIYTSRGYNSGPYLAIRPGGRGEVSDSHVIWRKPTGAPYVSSLLYYEGLLYMATEVGVVRCIDARDGETIWTERVGGNFTASPVGAGGRIYLLNEEGETVVLKAGREFEVLSRNPLNEVCRASLAAAAGRIFIRSEHHLFAVGTSP